MLLFRAVRVFVCFQNLRQLDKVISIDYLVIDRATRLIAICVCMCVLVSIDHTHRLTNEVCQSCVTNNMSE